MTKTQAKARLLTLAAVAAAILQGCGGGLGPDNVAIPLVDRFDATAVTGGREAAQAKAAFLWDFSDPDGAAMLGWKAAKGVSGLTHEGGVLRGRTTTEDAVLWVKIDKPAETGDAIHHYELRMRVDQSGKAAASTIRPGDDPATQIPGAWFAQLAIEAGQSLETVRLQPGGDFGMPAIGIFAICPVAQAGAEFVIESIRLVTQSEHRADTATGVSWQGLDNIYRETIAAHAPEAFTIDVDAPSNAWLDLHVGTVVEGAVAFRVESVSGESSRVLLERTVTTPQRWDAAPIELTNLSRPAKLRFSLSSDVDSALGFWGSPTIRVHGARPYAALTPSAVLGKREAPRGVIVILLDTLRRDRLSFYGHDRENAPNLKRLAAQGALFRDNVTPATWTKVAVTSLVTSLYPKSHRVHELPDRLSAQATTLAEVYRKAGYATVSIATNPFVGRATNLHQGYEELHESPAFDDSRYPAKTSREAVDRAVGWLDRHADVSFFMYLHVIDPHSPFEPRVPYDAAWADPAQRSERMAEWERIKKHIKNPFFVNQSVASRKEVEAAGVDPETYLSYQKDWYDGSILGMDAELGRVVQRLESLGLRDDVVLAVIGDHGEEFFEHGRMFHGQSVYGELANVPLFFYGPGRIPAGVEVAETVRSIDVMPTLLALSGLETPEEAHGQSLLPLIAAAASGQQPDPRLWEREPAVTEKAAEISDTPDDTDDLSQYESYGLVLDGWKLVHNVTRPEGAPEFELFDHHKDPLNLHNVAAEHPDRVEQLKTELERWRTAAEQSMLPKGDETPELLPPGELERLRSLGYI